MRKCYDSTWRLNRNDLEQLTPGRYYKAPKGARAFPFDQCFGSFYWLRGNDYTEPDIGEVWDNPRPFYSGDPPPHLPRENVCGPVEYFTAGSPNPPVPLPDNTVWGMLPCCFGEGIPERPQTANDVDFTDPAVLYMLAAITAGAYESSDATCLDIITGWLGTPLGTRFHAPDTSEIPGYFTAAYPEMTLAFVAGTTNQVQFFAQFHAINDRPGLVAGLFSTVPWVSRTFTIHDKIREVNVSATGPVVLVGHSYGGAIVSLLATRYWQASASRSIRLVTFGRPKPCGANTVNDLAEVRALRVENDTDPVCQIAPSADFGGFLASRFSRRTRNNWAEWLQPNMPLRVSPSGGLLFGFNSDPLGLTIFDLCRLLFGETIPDPFSTHLIQEYCRRLSLAILFGTDGYPVSAAAIAIARSHFP